MHLHQILTGAANPSDYSYAAGSIDSVHFAAYAAGYNIVILSGDFQRVQVLLSGSETNQSLLTCIDCTYHSGKIVAGFGNQLCIYEPSSTSERSLHHQVNYRWSLAHTITCSAEKIKAVAWHPKGEQMIVVCKSTLQIWALQTDEVESRSNRVSFDIGIGDGTIRSNQKTWKNIWHYKPASPIKQVTYSNDGTLFATTSQNDRLVKVWYRSTDSSAIISYCSTYLPHPRAVTYISWRKTSQFFTEGTVINCLLTCCKDNVCRIWCETRQQDESAIYAGDSLIYANQKKKQSDCLNHCVQKLYRMRNNYFSPSINGGDLPSLNSFSDNPLPATPASLISATGFNNNEDDYSTNFNPNPMNSLPLSSSRSSSSSSLSGIQNSTSSGPMVVRFHLATTIDPNGATLKPQNIPTYQGCMFIVQWLNNKDLYNLFSIEQFLYNMQRKNKGQLMSTTSNDSEETSKNINENQNDTTNGTEKKSIGFSRNNSIDDARLFLQIRSHFKKLIEEWKSSPDVVFSIHPADGSLLLWVIDCLDQAIRIPQLSWSPSTNNTSLINYQMSQRQVQVSFSARIPDVFPLGDALSLQAHLLIYCHDILFNQFLSLNQTKQNEHLPMINMITKHTNGTLNLWSLTFHEQQKFQSLICVTHTARMCGHHFPIKNIVCHPLIPLVLTSSYYDDQNDGHYGSKKRFENSLILWSTEPIGPLTMNDGITELARMKSLHAQAFRLIAWFPMVVPCLNIDLLRESPSVLFCASDGQRLRIYQVVCNAKILLASQFSTSKSYQTLNDNENKSIRSSPSRDSNISQLNVVSYQSNARPSCVISLAELADSECVWKRAELIHIFPANAIDDRTESDSPGKIYYLVLVEKSTDADHRSSIHMWKIVISYPDDDKETFNFNNVSSNREWIVQVHSTKICVYTLPVSADAELQSVDVAFGHLSSSTLCYSDSSSSSPYLLSTSHADQVIRFWTCVHKSSNDYQWSEWFGVAMDCQPNSRLKIDGQCLALSNAYCGRLAVAFRDETSVIIGIYECESTGGTAFQCESRFPLTEMSSQPPQSKIHFDWASIENGAHLLATSIGVRYVFIYSYTETAQWTKLRTIEISSINANIFFGPNLSLKWVRGGLLLVGVNSELQVYSQWSSLKRRCHSVKPEPLIKPKRRINTSSNLKRLANGQDSSQSSNGDQNRKNSTPAWLTLDSIDALSLFHAARNAAPVLPQYHPTVLLELVRLGKYRRVKAILAHLTRCIVSTVHSVEGRVEMRLMRSRTFSIATNDDNEQSIAEVEPLKYVEIDTIPLLPLFALFDSDHEIPMATSDHGPSSDNYHTDEQINGDGNNADKKYGDLFSNNTPSDLGRSVEFRFDEDQINDAERKRQIELNKFRRELQSNRNWSPAFDSRMVDLLVDYFQRIRLGNLTSLEQMHLLALADTLANSSDESLTAQTYSGVKPSNTMDACGLRFLIDVQRYIYLSKTVTPSNNQNNFALKHIVTSASYAWAFHSDSQEDLLSMLPCMVKNKPSWMELQLFGVGWWIRNKSIITRLFEKLAKAAFEVNNDPLDGALYFLALKKKSLLYNLYKHVQDTRMQEFFRNDFTEDRWIKAAQKNAFALLGKQRFAHAAAFFLLAGKTRDAIEVIINNLNDIQLALMVARLHDDEEQTLVNALLNREILKQPHEDPFYRSMAYWLLKDYDNSMNTLLQNNSFDQQQSVLIFYDHLKQHPLVLRARQLSQDTKTYKPDTFAVERRVHFQAAYYYLKMGCPLLALEILAKLPAWIPLVTEKPVTTPEPIQTKKVESDNLFDWSQPVSNKIEDDELKLEWSDDEKEEDKPAEEPLVAPSTSPKVEKTEITKQQCDTIGQYMKLICCLKIIVEEMSTLATGFEVTGGQLRHHLACWLQQEIGIVRQLCNLNTSEPSHEDENGDPDEPILSDLYDDTNFAPNAFTSVDSPPSSVIQPTQVEMKMKRLSRRRRWLKANEHLLRTLISFTSLHAMHGGGLASVRMELLLLLHELYRERQTQLKYPIPYPAQVPLLIANLSGTLSVSNNAISYIRDLSQDLLKTMNTWLTLPKLTEQSVQIVAVRDLSIALSSCVYQSLCNTKENQTSERIAVESFLKSYLYRRESVRLHRRKSVSYLIEQEAPTTAPKDWPGIKISINQNKDPETNIVKLKLLLVEILISVYMSLLIYALSTDDCNTLYRLLKRKWSTADSAVKLWYGVFGGGAKKPLACKSTSPNTTSSSVESNSDYSPSLLNERRPAVSSFARKMLNSPSQPAPVSYTEVFIPPRASIVNFFMAKISTDRDSSVGDNDEAISDGDDNEDEENEDEPEDHYNGDELTSEEKQKKIHEREHTDSMSYSWILMRYTIVRLVYKRLWAFFPHIGIEKHEIPSISPLIQQLLQNLNIWQDSLRRTLEVFNAPPDNYLPLGSGTSSDEKSTGLAIHRYRAILDPNNTPFSKSKSALPAKRLWNYLVNDEQSQGIFIKYIFKRKILPTPTVLVNTVHRSESRLMHDTPDNGSSAQAINTKAIYRDSEAIHSFCLNNANPTLLAAAVSKGIIELDISSLTSVNERNEPSDDETESSPSLLPQAPAMLSREGNTERMATTLRMPTMGGYVPNMYLTQTPMPSTNGNLTQNDNQHVLITRNTIRDCRKFANHPILPDYLAGCSDGSVFLLNWSRDATPRQVREAGKRVTKIEISTEGNKFGVADIEGNLSLHVLSNTRTTVYMRLLAHNKGANDFVFLDSSTILATSGLSADQQNVVIWDTLMPQSRGIVTSFSCHEASGGGQCLVYSPSHQLLISGGKRGEISIFDIRQRKRLASSQAHDSNLRALCLDPLEKFYITGSGEGNIKIWRVHGCELVHCLYGEHSRRGFLSAHISGVNHLQCTATRHLFSSGADGTISVRSLTQFD